MNVLAESEGAQIFHIVFTHSYYIYLIIILCSHVVFMLYRQLNMTQLVTDDNKISLLLKTVIFHRKWLLPEFVTNDD